MSCSAVELREALARYDEARGGDNPTYALLAGAGVIATARKLVACIDQEQAAHKATVGDSPRGT